MKYVFNTFSNLLPKEIEQSNMFGDKDNSRVSFYFPTNEEIRKILKIADHVSKRKKPLILDIGCGNGFVAYILAKTNKVKVIGIDPNKEQIEESKKIYKSKNLKLEAGDNKYAVKKYKNSKIDIIINSWMPVNHNFSPAIKKIKPKAIIYVRYKDNNTMTGKQSSFFKFFNSYNTGANYRTIMVWNNNVTQNNKNSIVEVQFRRNIRLPNFS